MKRLTFMVALLAILLAASVHADLVVNKITDEFSIESPYPVSTVKACECGTRTEILKVKNLGDFDTLFKVEVYSPIGDFISLSDDTFDLKPGEEQEVLVYIDAPCGVSLNTFYVARVSTNYGRSKELYKNFESRECQNILFSSELLSAQVLPGQDAMIAITVNNVGNFEDTFTITPESNQPYVVLSEETFTVPAEGNKTVYMKVTLPPQVSGDIEQTFSISSQRTGNSVRGIQAYSIPKDYDFAFHTENLQVSVCEDVSQRVELQFENLAGIPNKYEVEIRGPRFVNLSQELLSLGPKSNGTVDLVVAPRQIEIGEYEVTVKATSEHGFITKEKKIKLNVQDCFASSVTLDGFTSQIADKDCCGEKTYSLSIVNQGTYEEAYELKVDSPGWVSIDEQYKFVRVKPGEQVNVPVKATLPCTDATQTSYVIVKQLRAPFQEHEIAINLESVSQRTCHNVELLQDRYTINYQTSAIPILIANTGLRGGNYKVQLTEPASRFIYIEGDTLTLEPGEQAAFYAYPYNQTAFEEGTYLHRLSLNLSLEDDDITYERQFWIDLSDKNFLTKMFEWLGSINYSAIGLCGSLTILLLLLLIALIITVVYMRTKQDFKIKRIKATDLKKIKRVNMGLIGLLVVLILAIILIGGPDQSAFYEESQMLDSPLYHEWKQNTPYQINLNDYFEDPDEDSLTFGASQPNHIQVAVEGPVVTLTPEHGWSGTEHIIFSATDSNGASVQSDVMTLHVISRRPVSFIEYWNAYCTQINLAILMAMVIVILMISDVVEDKGYNYYRPGKNR